MARLIGHLDADCFYVSAERVRHSELRHLPVGVLGNQGACVIAKSYEMKAAGVKTGQPIWEATKLCPEGIYVKRDFRWYEILSREILRVLKECSPSVEYYSIDEMFFDAAFLPQTFSMSLQDAAVALQRRLLDEVGIPVSVGISRSRTLAKLISDTAKPFGCRVLLDRSEIDAFLRARPVEDITGIGGQSQKKLNSRGIFTCWDYSQADRKTILRMLTIKGEGIWWELHGEHVFKLQTTRPPHKAISRGGSLAGTTDDPKRIWGWMVRNAERMVEELDFHKVCAGRLTLVLSCKTGEAPGRYADLSPPTASFGTLLRVLEAMRDSLEGVRQVSHMHLFAERLCPRDSIQLSLFPAFPESVDKLAGVKREINQKIGRFAVRSGNTLDLPDVYADGTNDYDICDVRDKLCF